MDRWTQAGGVTMSLACLCGTLHVSGSCSQHLQRLAQGIYPTPFWERTWLRFPQKPPPSQDEKPSCIVLGILSCLLPGQVLVTLNSKLNQPRSWCHVICKVEGTLTFKAVALRNAKGSLQTGGLVLIRLCSQLEWTHSPVYTSPSRLMGSGSPACL